ncbi:transposase [Brucella intermedia]|nr:transposase [Brucella intermedia]WGJ08514.1 transposase [Brucella intermedia]
MSRGDLSESEWRVLKDLLPIEAFNRGRGRRPEPNRAIINGILSRLRCGTPWRDVPPKAIMAISSDCLQKQQRGQDLYK